MPPGRTQPGVFPPPASEASLSQLSMESQSKAESSSGGGDPLFHPTKPERHKGRKEPPNPLTPYDESRKVGLYDCTVL